MSLWKIAWRSIQHRKLASGLTALSMALGVSLVVAVLVVHGVIAQSFNRGAQGYDLIVGAKGSPLDLVLSTVYYLGSPADTIPYEYYSELQDGRYRAEVELAIPVCQGGNYKGYPIVGVTYDLFDKVDYAQGKRYTFREGTNFKASEWYTGVIGSTVARKTGLQIGDTFRPLHGMDPNQGEEHDPFTVVGILDHTGTPNDKAIFINIEGFFDMHQHCSGHQSLLKATLDTADNTDTDHDHATEAATDETADEHADEHADHDHEVEATASEAATPVPVHVHDENCDHAAEAERRLTAVLVLTNPERETAAQALPRWISDELDAQAVLPIQEITRLLEEVVGNIQLVLIILAVLVVVVAGIGMMVSIYNSMNERRHEIAVMRALGARRGTVMSIILCESILLSLGGGAIGVLLGHSLILVLGPWISASTGIVVSAFHFQLSELILIPGLTLLASVVGFLPAVIAYRTDVAESLGE